jgi:uncharacterized Zn finger protein
MECPSCGWKRIEETKTNFISRPKGFNETANHYITLPKTTKVYRCTNTECGHIWKVKL